MISSVKLRASAEWLRPVLENWILLYEAACRAFPQTTTDWFLEPCLVGLLSAAAWQAGFPSILEAKCQRPGRSKKNKQLDLLVLGPEGCFAFEGKIEYVAEELFMHRACTALREALDDASQCLHPLAHRYFGVSFGLLNDYHPSIDLSGVLTATLQHVQAHHPALDALAWVLFDQPGAAYRGCILAAEETPPCTVNGRVNDHQLNA